MNRRLFLSSSLVAIVTAGATGPRKKILITVFQRGAADGLNMVIPFGEPRYYELRPTIAIRKPDGTKDAALDLDGFFGLHPSLGGLKPIYAAGKLAVVHAVGSPDPTRSHFDAQDYMESGTPGRKATSDGWLNRVLPASQDTPSPVRAVSLGTSLARTLRGRNEAVAVASLADFQVRDARGAATFESMYAGTLDKTLSGTARETFDAVKLVQSVEKQSYTPRGGAKYPASRFGGNLKQIARLINAGVGLEVAFTDFGGWDTHVNQAGQLANLLTDFGDSLAAFYTDMGDRMEDIVVVTMSEFGRTARENGARGTDHGHANAMFVLGGAVRGGKVYGQWPGLAREQLYESRDLAVTTDFRTVLGELVTRHMGNPQPGSVFPGFELSKPVGLLI